MKRWMLMLGIYVVLGFATWLGLLATDFDVQHDRLENQPPSANAWFGTDYLGRDVFARTLQGTRLALGVGILAAGFAVALGVLFGLLAGWYRTWLDPVLSWFAAAVFAIPGILLILVIGYMLGPGFTTVLLAFGLVTWVSVFRQIRAEVMRLRNQEYVLAAEACGARTSRVFVHHLLRNLWPVIVIQYTLHFVYAIKVEVIISFLGIGILDQPSWGRMIAQAQEDLPQGYWWPLASATLAMFGLILAVQKLGDALQTRWEVRQVS